MNIDWSKAPDWAKKFAANPGGEKAWLGDEGYSYLIGNGGVVSWSYETAFDYTAFEIIEVRPVLWSGEGLPPVGTVCEYQTWVNREWKQTKVLAHHLGFAVHSWSVDGDDMEVDSAPPQDFRPILTPEQIEAEERLAAINYMEIDAGMCATAFDGDPEARVWIENLIDKGWRKKVAP